MMTRGRLISPNTRTSTKSTSPSSTSSSSTPRGKLSGGGYRENGSDRLTKRSQGGQLSPTGSKGTLRSSGRSPLQQRVSFVDDEKVSEAEDDREEAVEEAGRNASVYLIRSKGPKVQSLRYVRTITS